MIPAQKLGWMAGVIDLKGRIVVKKNSSRATAQHVLAVSSKEMIIIRELSSLTGIKSEIRVGRPTPDWMRKGCVEHCPDAHIHVLYRPRLPDSAVWSVTGTAMATVLHNLRPFLLSDRGYDEAYTSIMESSTLSGRGATAAVTSLRRLKELGWELPEKFEISLGSFDEILVL